IIALYQAELFKSVQRDSVNVYNDLVPPADRPRSVRENIDKLTTYLNDISSRYQEGVVMVFKDFQNSKVFIDTARSRLFVKVIANRSIDGIYYNKDQKKPNKSQEQIDFYVKVELKASGVPESKIYSIFIHEDNEGRFHPIKVVEKTAPIKFRNIWKDTVYRRAIEHNVAWQGGEIFERLRMDLISGKTGVGQPVIVATIDSSFVNDNGLRFLMEKKIKTGRRHPYYLQITKLSSEEQPVKSEVFYVKRRIPLLLQVFVPVIVVGGVTYLFMNRPGEAKDPVLPSVPSLE
ncbi:MAG TPA: hypothetical protein VFE50_23260, partial [Cyclobacteriaceae bacterium]|nr:hypothetical protein [Cyclobacteriaceae bacterium]